ncbi:MAG: helix-hairpin-helix domain-containing protein [Oscillospiraceae bacterium]|nr:helix-hairpin-helix domain-containing protein [Oscillospiraceae bacterium]
MTVVPEPVMKNDTKIILKLSAKALLVAVLAAMSLYNLFHGTTVCVKNETIYFSNSSDSDLVVNINTANVRELKKLDGIGRTIAQAIIDYRTENGEFASVDELINVKGIGEVKLEKIRDHVTV